MLFVNQILSRALGGDEFAVLLPDTGVEEAARVARKISVELFKELSIDQHKLYLSCSAGIAVFPDSANSYDEAMSHADQAMYFAKQNHLGVSIFGAEIAGQENRRFAIVEALNAVLIASPKKGAFKLGGVEHFSTDEFMMCFQPQPQHYKDGRLAGVESLIRWNSTRLGSVLPAEFIPVAESFGFMPKISNWCLCKVAEQAVVWEKSGIRPEKISFNLSATQLNCVGLVEDMLSIICAADAKPGWFEIEITETAMMQNIESAVVIFQELSDSGMTIAMDDFGTGYSSLAYLKKLPINTLKIDIEFIRGISQYQDDMTLVRSMIAISHALGIKVVAEGVETQAQLQLLKDEGCDIIQGYLYSKPLFDDDVRTYLEMASTGHPKSQVLTDVGL